MKISAATFHDMKVNTKIAAGFSAILAIMIGVGAYGYFGVAHVGANFEGYAQRVAVVDAVSEIDREFLTFRRLVRETATSQDPAAAAKLAHEEEQRVTAAIEHGIREIHNPERHEKIVALKERFEEYAKLARRAEILRQEKDEVGHKVLDADGAKLKADLEHLLTVAAREGNSNALILGNEVLKHVMQIRLSVNLLLGRHDLTAKEKADQTFGEVATILATLDGMISSPEARKDFDEVKKLVAEYHEGYEKAAVIDEELDQLLSRDMPSLAENVAADATAIRESASADEHALKAEATDLISTTETMMLWSGIGGVALGAFLAWVIGRGISTPIRAIAEVLLKLANGDKSVEVPYADRKDEVGENARAARIFKENLLRIEQMEAEQKEAERRAAAVRKADMLRLADEFQRAIGGVVDTVSAASSQLESAAGALTKTAETTQQLSGMVAAASEQTSLNVQGVAAAKALANQTGKATSEISAQVSSMQAATRDAVDAIQEITTTINRISEIAGAIAAAVEEQGATTQEISRNVSEAAKGTSEVASSVVDVSKGAGDTGSASSQVLSSAKALSSESGTLKREVEKFLANVRAA